MSLQVPVHLLQGGYCTHKEHMVLRSGSRDTVPFPSLFAVIEHPQKGLMLFDTGYSQHFFSATEKFPEKLYRLLTPVTLNAQDTAVAQLHQLGYHPEDVQYIIISHFHGDHVSALHDFPKAQFIYLAAGYEFVRKFTGFKAVRLGYLPSLLPADFESRSWALDPQDSGLDIQDFPPFEYAIDLFNDGSIRLIPLTGHFCGQMGALIESSQGPLFLSADACWYRESFEKMILPHPLAMTIMYDAKQYRKDLQALHDFACLHPETTIVPSHCTRSLEYYAQRKAL